MRSVAASKANYSSAASPEEFSITGAAAKNNFTERNENGELRTVNFHGMYN